MALQAWTGRTSGQIDADSPVDITLVGGIDDDITHLKQVLYGDGAGGYLTPIDGHRHNKTDSQGITTSGISTAQTNASTNVSSGAAYTLPAGVYGVIDAEVHIDAVTGGIQVQTGDGWTNTSNALNVLGTVISNGSNIRTYNSTSSANYIYYTILD